MTEIKEIMLKQVVSNIFAELTLLKIDLHEKKIIEMSSEEYIASLKFIEEMAEIAKDAFTESKEKSND